jgi:membrane-bound serine protease (ClpP class)
MTGKTGVAETVLRPSGKVLVDGKLYDAYTRGDYIEKGQPIEVISHEGPALKVKLQA